MCLLEGGVKDMSYLTLEGSISLDVGLFGSFTSESSQTSQITRRNSLLAPALHCLLLSLLPSNLTDIVNVEGIKAYNYNRGSLLS
jgi:hypothetical protein